MSGKVLGPFALERVLRAVETLHDRLCRAARGLDDAGIPYAVKYSQPAADVVDSEQGDEYRVDSLEALVRMKLTLFRRKDQVHLLETVDVGLIDAAWRDRLPKELAARLQELLDTPDG